jgi:hypothetical protein
LALSSVAGSPGDTIAVQLVALREGGGVLALVQGTLRFDPATLRYLGQALADDALVLIGDTGVSHGTLRVLSLRLGGLARTAADLRFQVLRAGYTGGLGYRFEVAAGTDRTVFERAEGSPAELVQADTHLPPQRMSLADWAARLGLDTAERPRPTSAGDGTVFGDVTLSGTVNGLDQLGVAALSVGLRPLLTDQTKDYAIAGDVAPANLPGLGEAGDPLPPGREADGSHVIN